MRCREVKRGNDGEVQRCWMLNGGWRLLVVGRWIAMRKRDKGQSPFSRSRVFGAFSQDE